MDKPKSDPYSTAALADKAAKTKVKPKKKVVRDVKGREVEAVFKDGKYTWQPKSQEKLKINGKEKPKLDSKPKETEAEARAKWEEKSKDSPARRSGAWDKDELWEKQKAHRKWKSDRKEGKLKTEKFDPRKGKGQRRKLVQKTPAELEADRRKKEIKSANNNKSTNKISPSVPVKEMKKKKPGFDPERSQSDY